jgi:two-component system chemotaxis sensor kinase CheA
VTQLLRQFLAEAHELVQSMSETVLGLERSPTDRQQLDGLFRSVHSLKGNSGLFDFPEISRVLHAAEDLMSALRERGVAFSPEIANALLDAVDFLVAQLEEIAASGSTGAHHAAHSARVADALRARIPLSSRAPSRATDAVLWDKPDDMGLAAIPVSLWEHWQQRADGDCELLWMRYAPEQECFFKGEDPALLAQRTPQLLWHRATVSDPRMPLPQLDPYRCQLRFELISSAPLDAIEQHFRYVREQVVIAPIPSGEHAGNTPARPRVDTMAEAVIDTQRAILAVPDSVPGLLGRIKAVGATVNACLRSTDRADLVVEWTALVAHAVAEASTGPLLSWINALNPDGGAPQASASQGGQAPVVIERPVQRFLWSGHNPGATVRIEQQKIDRLMKLIGEMVVAKNVLPFLAERASTPQGATTLGRELRAQYALIHRITTELQDTIMQVRLMPLASLLQSFPRLVRDTVRKLGKRVQLVMDAGGIAADKDVIEALVDPLVALLRNSMAHGIELPEARIAAGKPIEGLLELRAASVAGRLIIDVIDDGQGIHPETIRRKACERGLLSPDAAAQLDDDKTLELVFAPGFSTADATSELSGRGVGMDIVRSALEKLHGAVSLQSRPGGGTRVRLTLPLSISASRVLLVESNSQIYGVPMDAVVETVRVEPSQIHSIKSRQATSLRGRVVPLRSLNELLRVNEPQRPNAHGELSTLVIRNNDEYMGLIVDEFLEATDIILNPLDGILGGLRGYAGTALRGDGSILMVLSPAELVA